MVRKSIIFIVIKDAVTNGNLKQSFTVSEINSTCKGLLAKSPSFLSKHRKGNPGGYSEYFIRISMGKYKLKESSII